VSPRTLAAPLAATLLVLAACAHERFQWVERLPPTQPADSDYRVATGDVLSVRVWNQESMSTARARVREDGKISVPFLQDVEVEGMTPAEVSSRLGVKLKAFVVNPVVTVTLEERRPLRVSVLGEVARQGAYDLEPDSGVLQALATAGGITEYARRDGIFVLRHGYWADGNSSPVRIRFRYRDLTSGATAAAAFRLRTGDVVIVE
jgi:polysaccharide export outer membrane protein